MNLYADTKVEAEQLVSRLGAKAVVARLALVFGLPVLGATLGLAVGGVRLPWTIRAGRGRVARPPRS